MPRTDTCKIIKSEKTGRFIPVMPDGTEIPAIGRDSIIITKEHEGLIRVTIDLIIFENEESIPHSLLKLLRESSFGFKEENLKAKITITNAKEAI